MSDRQTTPHPGDAPDPERADRPEAGDPFARRLPPAEVAAAGGPGDRPAWLDEPDDAPTAAPRDAGDAQPAASPREAGDAQPPAAPAEPEGGRGVPAAPGGGGGDAPAPSAPGSGAREDGPAPSAPGSGTGDDGPASSAPEGGAGDGPAPSAPGGGAGDGAAPEGGAGAHATPDGGGRPAAGPAGGPEAAAARKLAALRAAGTEGAGGGTASAPPGGAAPTVALSTAALATAPNAAESGRDGRGGTPADADAAAGRTAAPAGAESGPEAQRRSSARERALTAKPVGARAVQVLLAVAFPFLVLVAAVKAVASPWFLWLEYHRPGFPPDTFGFSDAERLTYGSYGVDYLNNTAGPEYLGGLAGPSGDPLFLASEVAHMADVKAVLAVVYGVAVVVLVAAAAMAWYLARRYAGGVRRALFGGTLGLLAVLAAVAVLAVLDWQAFFATFHQLFFAEGTWTFRVDDTLIRLYPGQFWVDAGLAIAVLVLAAAAATLAATWPTRRRRERSRLAREATRGPEPEHGDRP